MVFEETKQKTRQ